MDTAIVTSTPMWRTPSPRCGYRHGLPSALPLRPWGESHHRCGYRSGYHHRYLCPPVEYRHEHRYDYRYGYRVTDTFIPT